MPVIKIAASILSADMARLGEQVAEAEAAGCDYVHLDVMDGHFVPNLTIGPVVVEAVRRVTALPLDVHLMIERPESLLGRFREAGADLVTVHAEACADPAATLDAVRASGARTGLSLRPGTPLATVEPWLGGVDLLLVMTVEPGFGGQSFRADMLDKVRAARQWRERHGARFLIEVDGGIAPATAPAARAAGADVFVAGNAIYGQDDPAAALAALRAAVR
jgi:ribulose-phosphate 3-epimerase